MLGEFGTTEVIIAVVILILLFGGKKIPEFIQGLREAVREFRKAVGEE